MIIFLSKAQKQKKRLLRVAIDWGKTCTDQEPILSSMTAFTEEMAPASGT